MKKEHKQFTGAEKDAVEKLMNAISDLVELHPILAFGSVIVEGSDEPVPAIGIAHPNGFAPIIIQVTKEVADNLLEGPPPASMSN